jgi:hypothetical protein
MGQRGRKSILREAMKAFLQQHKAQGLQFDLIEQRFGAVDRRRLLKLLANMRLCGEAYCTRSKVSNTATWFPGCDESESQTSMLSSADWVRLKRARQADKASPIVFYGDHLPCGRCSSVWEFARRHQEQRA